MTATSTVDSPSGPSSKREERRVLAGTLVGTTIEWYDFFIFAQLTATLLAPLFLSPLEKSNPGVAQLLSFATIGISFLFRPLGAFVAGHLGDKMGRKAVLVMTLVMMGAATALIGVLPTYETIGLWAPVLLIFLRVVQGFSAGGEWGGAALMAVEHAPIKKRGLFGAYPQIGVPIGMILATGLLFFLQSGMSKEAFSAWGWRVPFLLSVVLIVVGYLIRRAVGESPVFKELAQRKAESKAPLGELFRRNKKEVVLAALIFIANNAAGYLLIAFFISYATKALKMPLPQVLLATTIASFGWLIFTMVGGWLSDKIGRVKTFLIGYGLVFAWMIPMFALIDTKDILLYGTALFVLTIGLGLSYGPMSAMYAEMFPAQVRYSGISIGYALGAILGGAFAPLIAQALLDATKWSGSVGLYIMGLCIISAVGVILAKETRGRPLGYSVHH
ncbi:MFS transporter [Arthrobacter sp. StoSoilB3]|jgi:MFS family permease|uniref:MFS family permease n=1 Tax=Paenarthrobacter nicotinovorans TaxID=29320 RepID=A0ABT9TI01_PAENI|nr:MULTISPECIES: MFS transporter [Paenarthrobacter]KIA72379.1 major facilitator transporter [Arthrobacter sp. MWB30]KQR06549.1 MFS transporter [Arthrobacter sp. Leaf145]SKB30635.1 Predicted arabinose efflux permease, MFS family [Arthrobacter sp. 31Cvi3.1E]BCW41018.1 MFS transporter [Arthrobacter sp. StoSoilB3]MBP2396184.1 MFS family permease [Paenarthrobacter nicotinovorans]